MKVLTKYELVQNEILGACCLSRFIWSYNAQKNVPTPFPLTALVIPICFHEETVSILNRRALKGGLLNAKIAHRDLGVGLQERMEDMFPQSMNAVLAGIQIGLFGYDQQAATFSAIGHKIKIPKLSLSVQKMFWTADRLASWIAETSIEVACSHLNIEL